MEVTEYVELLDVPVVYAANEDDIVEEKVIASETEEDETHEIEYVDQEEVIVYNHESQVVENGHTILVHDGKQYMIPSNAFHQNGEAIVFEQDNNSDGGEITMVIQEDYEAMLDKQHFIDGNVEEEKDYNEQVLEAETTEHSADNDECYLVYGGENDQLEENNLPQLGRQYAVLKDGKLHIQAANTLQISTGSVDVVNEDGADMHEKLQQLEHTLNSYSVVATTAEEDSVESEAGLDEEDEQEPVQQITGRNLITGQTISLSGFLEKIKRKIVVKEEPMEYVDYQHSTKYKRPRRTIHNMERSSSATTEDEFMLVPPNNKRVIVGKTPDGKRIIGKILQIQKKLTAEQPSQIGQLLTNPNTSKSSLPHHSNASDSLLSRPNLIVKKKKCVRRANVYDQNIVRTLSGLMELESIEKNLAYKNLIVKHVLKKSVAGKVLTGKQITYYTGHMSRRTSAGTWTFVSSQGASDDDDDCDNNPTSINLRTEDEHHVDSQQVHVRMIGDGKMIYLHGDEGEDEKQRCKQQQPEYEETVTVNLIVTQDEHGKKRTKVIIPQLGGAVSNKTATNRCQSCGHVFKSQQQLHRHQVLYQHGDDANSDTPRKRYHRQQLFTCHVCNKSFNTSGSLRRHVTIHNPNMRPLQCLACMQRFTDESSLKKHMVLHTGVRPYQCELCARTFVHQGDLNFHRKIHDPVKRYRCDVCGKQFNRHSNMVRHADIHRPSVAAPCTSTSDLENATKGPPYICDTCGCQYNFVSSLTRHIVNNHMGSTTANSAVDSISYSPA